METRLPTPTTVRVQLLIYQRVPHESSESSKEKPGIFHSQLSEISRAKHQMAPAPDARTWMLKSWRIYHRPWWRKPVSSRPMAWSWRPMAVGLPTWSSCRWMLGKRGSDVEMLGLKMALKTGISLGNIWKYNFWDVWGSKTLDCQWEQIYMGHYLMKHWMLEISGMLNIWNKSNISNQLVIKHWQWAIPELNGGVHGSVIYKWEIFQLAMHDETRWYSLDVYRGMLTMSL